MENGPGNKGRFWTLLGLAVGILAICFALDGLVYQFVHENWNYYTRPIPDHLKLATRVMRSLEVWGENVFITCVLYAMWVLDRKHRSRVVMLIATAVLATLPVEFVKRLAGRERPDQCEGQTIFHGPMLWNEGGDYQSFPSGHTASGAAFSGSLSSFYPPLRPVAVSLAVGCGASRIWKERHFLSDCWAGGALGFALAFYLPRTKRVREWCEDFDRRWASSTSSSGADRAIGNRSTPASLDSGQIHRPAA